MLFARGPLGPLVLSPSPTGIIWHQHFEQVKPVSYPILSRRHNDSVLFTELLPLECQHVQKIEKNLNFVFPSRQQFAFTYLLF